eukprot:761475-Hanusia_phi.AAC.6
MPISDPGIHYHSMIGSRHCRVKSLDVVQAARRPVQNTRLCYDRERVDEQNENKGGVDKVRCDDFDDSVNCYFCADSRVRATPSPNSASYRDFIGPIKSSKESLMVSNHDWK